MYIIICEAIAGPCLMHETGCSGLVHWDDPGGWDVEGSGREGSGWGTHGHPWLIHVNVWQKPSQHFKVIILQLKYINFLKKNPPNIFTLVVSEA